VISTSPAPEASDVAASPSGQSGQTYPSGLLVAIRTSKHSDHDSVEFEFGGTTPPAAKHEFVDAVTEDPSDRPVPLQGNAFVWLVFKGATVDTSAYENPPHKYPGPTRIAPVYPVFKEIALAGSFENVLSFGIGLDRKSRVSVENHTNPSRVTLNFWYS
jgi:hypothetical protein